MKQSASKSMFSFNHLDSTHSGGKGDYLHDWYPYLEGFSSNFVKDILSFYMPNAKSILEPFAGVGTTPIYCSLNNLKSYYCEVNPAVRKVINAKHSIISMTKEDKKSFINNLEEIIKSLDVVVEEQPISSDLLINYDTAFGQSIFFEEDTFELLLKFRSLIDTLDNELLAETVEVAVMSCIVKCSLLKRSGDVRFKTEKELSKGIPDLLETVKTQLKLMSGDCKLCPSSNSEITLITENARELESFESVQVDAVITSPPYLNGTNYFRNTKLELWFIKQLNDKKQLRTFRDEALTSGINDVTKRKGSSVLPLISELHENLLQNSYDSRIPIMVASYFNEMKSVFKGLKHHTKNKGVICIDIGDSAYSNIHVQTHKILTNIGNDLGWKLKDEVLLRGRRSKGGKNLGQYLLVFENRK